MQRYAYACSLILAGSLSPVATRATTFANEPVVVAQRTHVDGAGVAHRLEVTSSELGPDRRTILLHYSSRPPLGDRQTATMTVDVDGRVVTLALDDGRSSWSSSVDGSVALEPTLSEVHVRSGESGRTWSAYGRTDSLRLLRRSLDSRLVSYVRAIAALLEVESMNMSMHGEASGSEPSLPTLSDCTDICDECTYEIWEHGFAIAGVIGACAITAPTGAGVLICAAVAGSVLVDGARMADTCESCDSCRDSEPAEGAEPDGESPESEARVG